MNRRQLKGQRLIVIFLVGSLLFNYPLLSIFSPNGMLWGIPILYIYIFTAWAALIGLLALVVEYYR